VVDLTVAIRVPPSIKNHCWGIGLGKRRIGFFAQPGKPWLFYGRWNASGFSQSESHSPYKQTFVDEGMATFKDRKSHVRLVISTDNEFQQLHVWLDGRLLCEFNERKRVAGNAPVVVHASHACLIVEWLAISTF
jgi:hypothetical protein